MSVTSARSKTRRQVLIIGVDYHALVLREPGQMGKTWRLESAAAGEFGQLLIAAVWQAAHQAGEMAAEAVRDG